jgi:hypothetical protein
MFRLHFYRHHQADNENTKKKSWLSALRVTLHHGPIFGMGTLVTSPSLPHHYNLSKHGALIQGFVRTVPPTARLVFCPLEQILLGTQYNNSLLINALKPSGNIKYDPV